METGTRRGRAFPGGQCRFCGDDAWRSDEAGPVPPRFRHPRPGDPRALPGGSRRTHGEAAAGLPAVRSPPRLQPLRNTWTGTWGTNGVSPINGDPKRQHRHVTPGRWDALVASAG